MTAKAFVLAAVLLFAAVGLGPATGTAEALHVCVTSPCDHGPIDDISPVKQLLCKLTGGAWSSTC